MGLINIWAIIPLLSFNLIKPKTKCGLFESDCDEKMMEHSQQLIEKFSKSMSTENISVYAGHMRSSRQHADSDYIVMFSQKLKLSNEQTRLLVVSGVASGIAATFNAPIGGVLFGLEILPRDGRSYSVFPLVVS